MKRKKNRKKAIHTTLAHTCTVIIEMEVQKMPREHFTVLERNSYSHLHTHSHTYGIFVWMLDEFPFMHIFYLFIAQCSTVCWWGRTESARYYMCAFECKTIVPPSPPQPPSQPLLLMLYTREIRCVTHMCVEERL